MKKTTNKGLPAAPRSRARNGPALRSPTRVGIAEAKAELSRVLRGAAETPTIIHNRGRDVAVLLGVEEYERLVANDDAKVSSMSSLLADIEDLKRRFGGGADPGAEQLTYEPRDPFATRAR